MEEIFSVNPLGKSFENVKIGFNQLAVIKWAALVHLNQRLVTSYKSCAIS